MTSDHLEEALELICRAFCDVQRIDPDELAAGLPMWQSHLAEARQVLQSLNALDGTARPSVGQSAFTVH